MMPKREEPALPSQGEVDKYQNYLDQMYQSYLNRFNRELERFNEIYKQQLGVSPSVLHEARLKLSREFKTTVIKTVTTVDLANCPDPACEPLAEPQFEMPESKPAANIGAVPYRQRPKRRQIEPVPRVPWRDVWWTGLGLLSGVGWLIVQNALAASLLLGWYLWTVIRETRLTKYWRERALTAERELEELTCWWS